MLYPLTFRPILKERVWGGAQLRRLYGKPLPAGVPIGESWEISDRPGDISVIANGSLAGNDLHWLIERYGADVLGSKALCGGRFPLLIKILDAREKLSLQVHPPAEKAKQLGGDPKTEMWFIADAEPGAELYVGLRRGVTQSEFQERLATGTVSDCFHRVPVKKGDTMFLPSGRVHAIGAGLVIFEIQQNSDTTYRVFDWNRLGLDGKPRALHFEQALASIDFADFEPSHVESPAHREGDRVVRDLVTDPLFTVKHCSLDAGRSWTFNDGQMVIIGIVSGGALMGGGGIQQDLAPGQFCMIPSSVKATLSTSVGVAYLEIR